MKLPISKAAYDEIRQALIDRGAGELIMDRDRRGEALVMEDIALVHEPARNATD